MLQMVENIAEKFPTCASWIFMEFPLAFASDSFPFQTLLSPLYSYLLSRKLKPKKKNTILLVI